MHGARSLATEFLTAAVDWALTDTLEVSQRIKMLSIPTLSPQHTLASACPTSEQHARGLGKPVHLAEAIALRKVSLAAVSGRCLSRILDPNNG